MAIVVPSIIVLVVLVGLSVFGFAVLKKRKIDPSFLRLGRQGPDSNYLAKAEHVVHHQGPEAAWALDSTGFAMIHHAAIAGDSHTVVYLLGLQSAVNINMPSGNGNTSLMWASELGKGEVIVLAFLTFEDPRRRKRRFKYLPLGARRRWQPCSRMDRRLM